LGKNASHIRYPVSCIEETICFDKLKVNSTDITCKEHDISVILSSVIIFLYFCEGDDELTASNFEWTSLAVHGEVLQVHQTGGATK
jgi:hypothetical protein